MERLQRPATVIIAGLVILGSLVSLWLRFRPAALKVDRAPIIAAYAAIGEALARETAKAVQEKGRIVLVTNRDLERDGGQSDDRWKPFQTELKKYTALSVVGTEILPVDPNEGMPPSCSRVAFKELLERNSQADAIVFFFSLPEWPRVSELIPKNIVAKIIVADSEVASVRIHYGGYFERSLLSSLIFPKLGGDGSLPTEPTTPREWFDKHYVVITQENYESLPD